MKIEDYRKQQARLRGRSWPVTISAAFLSAAATAAGFGSLLLIDEILFKILAVTIFGAAAVVFALYAVAGKKGSFPDMIETVLMVLYT